MIPIVNLSVDLCDRILNFNINTQLIPEFDMMRRLFGGSILTLIMATLSFAHAQDASWFRLQVGAPILFTGGTELPDNGGPSDGGGIAPIGFEVVANENPRAHGQLNVDVFVTGVDSSHTVTVSDLPAGAVWNPDASELGVGTIFWSASQTGSFEPIIEVHDADGVLVAEQRIELFIYPQLTASVPVAAFEADVGQELTIVPSVSGLIDEGDVRWGVTPSDLPGWLSFDELSGTIEVDTGSANSVSGLVLTAVDQNDFATDDTGAFSVAVLEAGPDITPDPFTIAPATNVEPRWEVTSAAITPLGYEAPTTVVVSGAAQVSVEGGDWGSTAAISPGQSFLLKTVAPDQGQTLTADVKVGPGEPATWSVTSWAETVRTISASTTSADPQALFGSLWTHPSYRKRLIIEPGATVSSTVSTKAALTINSALRGGLLIENQGVISGIGGDGGIAGSITGKDGGDALLLQSSGVKVINTGVIAGGGGGGGLGGKGANGKRTIVTRTPSSGEQYVKTTMNWFDAAGIGPTIFWDTATGGILVTPSTATAFTHASCVYSRGTLRATEVDGSKRYAMWRECTSTNTVIGGAGGNGGKGATYPTMTGATGTPGGASPGSGAGAGGRGGNGGAPGAAGATGNTGATGTNGSPSTGADGGAGGYSIRGTPAPGSVLGTLYGAYTP